MGYGHRPSGKGKSFDSYTGAVFHVLVVVLLILFVINTFYLLSISQSLEERFDEAAEAARPAVLDVITISGLSCDECDQSVLSIVDPERFNISSQKDLAYTDPEAIDLIEQYNIERLPAVIVTGEVEKSGLSSMMQSVDGALVGVPASAPFVDTQGKVRGIVDITLISADDCDDCFDLTPLITILSEQFTVGDVTELDEDDASTLIEKYNLESLPVLVIDSEASLYENFAASWTDVGTVENDGSFVLREVNPPYKVLESGDITGLVKITYLTDDSCEDCYNVSSHDLILEDRLGVFFAERETFDISSSEGQALVSKYEITAVPAVILSPEIQDYDLEPVLGQVGEYTADGTFVFREVSVMGNYYDLEAGEFVDIESQLLAQQQ